MAAEGVPLGQAYGQAIHRYPLFQRLPMPRKHRGAQYAEVRCPHAEHAATETICTLAHPLLLTDRKSLSRIVEAVARIKENADELAETKSPRGARPRRRGGAG
jgi:dTDP-4-amino-4,6-dideoxygalactose transaminase